MDLVNRTITMSHSTPFGKKIFKDYIVINHSNNMWVARDGEGKLATFTFNAFIQNKIFVHT